MFSPGESLWTEEPGRLRSTLGCKKSDTAEWLSTAKTPFSYETDKGGAAPLDGGQEAPCPTVPLKNHWDTSAGNKSRIWKSLPWFPTKSFKLQKVSLTLFLFLVGIGNLTFYFIHSKNIADSLTLCWVLRDDKSESDMHLAPGELSVNKNETCIEPRHQGAMCTPGSHRSRTRNWEVGEIISTQGIWKIPQTRVRELWKQGADWPSVFLLKPDDASLLEDHPSTG